MEGRGQGGLGAVPLQTFCATVQETGWICLRTRLHDVNMEVPRQRPSTPGSRQGTPTELVLVRFPAYLGTSCAFFMTTG